MIRLFHAFLLVRTVFITHRQNYLKAFPGYLLSQVEKLMKKI